MHNCFKENVQQNICFKTFLSLLFLGPIGFSGLAEACCCEEDEAAAVSTSCNRLAISSLIQKIKNYILKNIYIVDLLRKLALVTTQMFIFELLPLLVSLTGLNILSLKTDSQGMVCVTSITTASNYTWVILHIIWSTVVVDRQVFILMYVN